MKSRLFDALREAVAPTFRCLNCGADVFDQTGFCEDCLPTVPFNNGKTCKHCGVALCGEEDYCSHCVFEKTYFDRAFSPFCYSGCVQKAILDMKFHNIASNAKVLARYLVFCAKRNNIDFDVVTFVPMSKKSQKQRGYNQSQLLAEYFCELWNDGSENKVLFYETLQKVKETERQEKLGKKQRTENLVGAFVATVSLKNKKVLLIDDVKTTGATLNECAKALKKKGAAAVIGLTVASREETLMDEIIED